MIEDLIDKKIDIWFRKHMRNRPWTRWQHDPKTQLVAEFIDEDDVKIIKRAFRDALQQKGGVKVEQIGADKYAFEITDSTFDDDYLITPDRLTGLGL